MQLKIDSYPNTTQTLEAEEAALGIPVHRDHLFMVEELITELVSRSEDIINNQRYEAEKEDEFSHSHQVFVSSFVMFTTLQIIFLLASAVWQICSLRNFFVSKKLG